MKCTENVRQKIFETHIDENEIKVYDESIKSLCGKRRKQHIDKGIPRI